MAKGICSAEGCDRPCVSRGWCQMHYCRWRKHGTTDAQPPPAPAPVHACSAEGCAKPRKALGLCALHWDRQYQAKRRTPLVELTSLPGERWLPIPGYVGIYEVSDLGRIRSMTRMITHSNGHESTYRGKLLRLQTTRGGGYHTVRLSVNSIGENMAAHVAVMEAFVGPRPTGLEICHGDGNPANNRADNLRYDTPSANQQDKVRHGRHHNTNKAACPQDHLLQVPNLTAYSVRQGFRACRTCNLTDSARRKAAKAGLPFDPHEYAEQKYRELMEQNHDPGRVEP